MIGQSYSKVVKLSFGVAQCSFLGLAQFNNYTRSLYHYIQPVKFVIFGFADDHLLKSFLPIFQVKVLDKDINHCFNMISGWMHDNFLCLNQSKTTVLVIIPSSLTESIVINGTFITNRKYRHKWYLHH